MKKSLFKYYLILFFLVGISGSWNFGRAQLDHHYSQYMFNYLVINPAFAGSQDLMNGVILFRRQWIGVKGAPMTANIGIHGRSKEKHGFGVNLINESVGLTNRTGVYGNYAYRFTFKNVALAMGLKGGVMNYHIAWSRSHLGEYEADVLPANNQNLILPIAGAGLFLSSSKFYVGVSVPNFIKNKYNSLTKTQTLTTQQIIQGFISAGATLPIGENVDVMPSVLLKVAEKSPPQFDINTSFLIKKSFYFGLSYRHLDAFVVLLGYQLENGLKFGYAYDFPLSKMINSSSGSHELMIGFNLQKENTMVLTPRMF